MEKFMEKLMTQRQSERLVRNQKICESYKALREKYPTSSNSLVYQEIAKEFDINFATVRTICIAGGVVC